MNRWVYASLAGLSTAGFVVGQARRLSLVSGPGVILLFIALLLASTLPARWLIDHFVLDRIDQVGYPPRVNKLWLAGALVAGMLLAVAIPVELPRYPAIQTLEILATGEKNPLAGNNLVKLRGLYDLSDNRISFINFTQQGKWSNPDHELVTQKTPAGLLWQGNFADPYRLIFNTDHLSGMVEVVWNGEKQRLDLYTTSPGIHVLYLKPQTGGMRYREWFFGLCTGIFIGLVLYLLSLYLVTHRLPGKPALYRASKWQVLGHIAAYGLPLATIWSILLCIFWPGMMSTDSLAQWAGALAGNFNDWHPLFHSINLWLVARLWPSPAAVAIVQIVALSFVSGWWFTLLYKYGAPRRVTLSLLVIFALLPMSGLLVITLWKDVPYSIAILALSGMLLEISASKGRWLHRRVAWVTLGIVAALIALYRHNGLPVALGTLASLPLFYRSTWRPTLYSLLLMIFAIWLARGPLYRAFHATTIGSQQIAATVLLHPITAYIYFGTSLSSEQARVLGQIRPLDDLWDYQCFSVNPTMNSPFYNAATAVYYQDFLRRTLVDLTRGNPTIYLRHLACVSSLIWRLVPYPHAYLYRHAITWDRGGNPNYIVDNSLGIREHSLLPGILKRYTDLVKIMDSWLIWRPALYLYLSIFGAAVFVLRRYSWQSVLFLIPASLQSTVLALVNVAQDFRYQFAIYLISFFSLGLMFTTRSIDERHIHQPAPGASVATDIIAPLPATDRR